MALACYQPRRPMIPTNWIQRTKNLRSPHEVHGELSVRFALRSVRAVFPLVFRAGEAHRWKQDP